MASYMGGINIDNDLADLTKEEIMGAGWPILFGKADRRTRRHLLETVSLLKAPDQARIHMAAVHKRAQNLAGHPSQPKRQKTTADEQMTDDGQPGPYDDSEFLRAPERSVMDRCISSFIDRTGNAAVATAVCVVCARSMALADTRVLPISAIPNGHLLAPSKRHPAHELTGEMLLQRSAIQSTNTGDEGGFIYLFNIGRADEF